VETFDHILALLRLLMSATGGMLTSFEVMWSDVVDTVLSTGRHQRPLSAPHNFCALIEVGATDAEPLLEAAIGSAFEGGIVSDAVIAKSEAQAMDPRLDRLDIDTARSCKPGHISAIPNRHCALRCILSLVGVAARTALDAR
jgi:FAD-dependent oxidoreductase family protein